MKVFFRRIPQNTTIEDLCRFIQPAVEYQWYNPLRQHGVVEKCQLIEIQERRKGHIETHAVADIQPARAAEVAILRLNGRKLGGQIVEVRHWHERSPENDRRNSRLAEIGYSGSEKRWNDRRRIGLNVRIRDLAV